MVPTNNLIFVALTLLMAVAVLPSPVLALQAQQAADFAHLTALPKPSTVPFGLRLAIADRTDPTAAVNLTLTWSTTAPLTHPACVLLFQPTSKAHVDGVQKKYQHQDKIESLPYFSRRTQSISHASAGKQQLIELNHDVDNPTFICGSSTAFIEPATQKAAHYIHTVLLQNLESNGKLAGKYEYKCGNHIDGWSSRHSFVVPPPPGRSTSDDNGNDIGSTNFLLLGDMGVAHALTLPSLIKDAINGTVEDDNNTSNRGQRSQFSALVHVGDIAYDLRHYQGRKGQHFLRMIEPISSSMPYMVAPGNHEAAYNFSHYRALFKMPQYEETQNLYYSFDMGLIHVVVYNSEVFFWPESYGVEQMQTMFEWLERDLKKAFENRKQVPWLMAIAHRPMYCGSVPNPSVPTTQFSGFNNNNTFSDTSHSSEKEESPHLGKSSSRCGWEAEASRRGIPSTCPHNNPRWCHNASNFMNSNGSDSGGASAERTASSATFPIEELFNKYKVDLFVAGHVHDYERYWPVYNYTYTSYNNKEMSSVRENRAFVEESSERTTASAAAPGSIYKNPKETVHIISGAGGNSEMRIGPGLPPQGPCSADAPWCAFQSGHAPLPDQGYDFSYSRVFVHNASHLQWQQYSVTFDKIIDEFWVVQEDGHR